MGTGQTPSISSSHAKCQSRCALHQYAVLRGHRSVQSLHASSSIACLSSTQPQVGIMAGAQAGAPIKVQLQSQMYEPPAAAEVASLTSTNTHTTSSALSRRSACRVAGCCEGLLSARSDVAACRSSSRSPSPASSASYSFNIPSWLQVCSQNKQRCRLPVRLAQAATHAHGHTPSKRHT